MGGLISAYDDGADLWQVVGGSERGLYARQVVAITEEDTWVDPVPHRSSAVASERAHSPHFAATHAPRPGEALRGIQLSSADEQTGARHQDVRPGYGRVDQTEQRRRGPRRDAPRRTKPLCHSGVEGGARLGKNGLARGCAFAEGMLRVVQEHQVRLSPEVLDRPLYGFAQAYGVQTVLRAVRPRGVADLGGDRESRQKVAGDLRQDSM